jgi:glucose/arabinose dehydrogenase
MLASRLLLTKIWIHHLAVVLRSAWCCVRKGMQRSHSSACQIAGFLFCMQLAVPLHAEVRFAPILQGGLGFVTDIAHAGDQSHRLFLAYRSGEIRIVQNSALLPTPFLNLGTRVDLTTEGGLLGMAFDPQFASNGHFYVFYSNNPGVSSSTRRVVVSRFTRSAEDANLADPASEMVVLTFPHTYDVHYGGSMKFGPDGYLYIATGDNDDGADASQNFNSLLGKILRIDPNDTFPYAIPPGNPYSSGFGPGNTTARPEIWALGLRNPWRISFDRQTGDLYIADVGNVSREEVNRQPAGAAGGANYGWPTMEGAICQPPTLTCQPPPRYVAPLFDYPHPGQAPRAITGGFVYRGKSADELAGKYMFADYVVRTLFIHPVIANTTPAPVSGIAPIVVTFGEGETGELYFQDLNSGVLYSVSSNTDIMPEPFTLFPRQSVPRNTWIEANRIRLSGLGTSVLVSVSGGQMSPGCNDNYFEGNSVMRDGDWLCIRQLSATGFLESTATQIAVGRYTTTFVTQTLAPATVPGIPQIDRVIIGDTYAAVIVSPPQNDGGAPLLDYRISCGDGMWVADSRGPLIELRGISNGVILNCTIRGRNSVGYGLPTLGFLLEPSSSAPLTHVASFSRLTHDGTTFDLFLPAGGSGAIEPRLAQGSRQIIFKFNRALNSISGVQVSSVQGGTLTPSTAILPLPEFAVAVTVSGAPEIGRITVQLAGVNGALDVSAAMRLLPGDVNGTGIVTAADIAYIKAQSGTPNANNYKADINASGSFNSVDISAAKAKAGMVLP